MPDNILFKGGVQKPEIPPLVVLRGAERVALRKTSLQRLRGRLSALERKDLFVGVFGLGQGSFFCKLKWKVCKVSEGGEQVQKARRVLSEKLRLTNNDFLTKPFCSHVKLVLM